MATPQVTATRRIVRQLVDKIPDNDRRALEEAYEDVQAGRVISHEELLTRLGLE